MDSFAQIPQENEVIDCIPFDHKLADHIFYCLATKAKATIQQQIQYLQIFPRCQSLVSAAAVKELPLITSDNRNQPAVNPFPSQSPQINMIDSGDHDNFEEE